jgi:hypothetical protein
MTACGVKFGIAALRRLAGCALLSSLLVGGGNAFGWGHLPDLRSPEGTAHLVFAVLERSRIGYCTEVGNSGYPEIDIDLQVEGALNVWLAELDELLDGPVLIEKDCDELTTDLTVTIGPAPADSGATYYGRHELAPLGDRTVSMVLVNTAPMHGIEAERTNIFEFSRGLGDRIAKAAFLEDIRSRGLSLSELAQQLDLATTLPLTSSVYQTLVHEMGHSFGLCDVREGLFETKCDRGFRTRAIPNAVMSIVGEINLTFDDRDGIRALFQRYMDPPPAPVRPAPSDLDLHFEAE